MTSLRPTTLDAEAAQGPAARPAVRQTREQLGERIEALRATIAEAEREQRRRGAELAELRYELTQVRALLRNAPPTE